MIGLCGCAYAIVRGGAIDLSQAQRIEQGIQNVRELSFKTPVPMLVMTPDEAEQLMVEDIERDYSDDHLKIEAAAGELVGLFPAGTDLKAETLKLLKSQVAGFYEPHRKEMILVSGSVDIGFWNRVAEFVIRRDLAGEMLLAHELTHSLQDQHFALNERLEKVKDNDDRALALKSVAEGDATLASLGFVAGKMDDATADLMVSRLAALPSQFAAKDNGTPEALSAPLIFQYSEGSRFVAEAFHRGEWSAVDALYRNPPQSTQQIMHPGMYFSRRISPTEITVAGYQQPLKGWEKVDDNTLGELMLKVILQRNLGAAVPAVRLAQSWAGDQMVVLRKGDSVTVLWLLAFSDADSAAQFAAAYAGVLDRLFGAGTTRDVCRKSSNVLVVVGHSVLPLASLEPAIWKASTFHRPAPSPTPPIRAGLKQLPGIASSPPTASPRL